MSTGNDKPGAAVRRGAVAVSVDERIAEDRRCLVCGYNLRGLTAAGRCPECGTAVRDSLVGLQLKYAYLPWLRTIRRGFWLMKTAIALCVAAAIGSIGAVLLGPPTGSTLLDHVVTALGYLFAGLLLLALLAALIGFVQATRVEPRIAHAGEGLSARRMARLLSAISLGGWVAFQSALALLTPSAVLDQVVIYTPHVLALLSAAAVGAFTRYVTTLLDRTADSATSKLARQVAVVVVVVLIAGCVMLVASAGAALYRSTPMVAARLLSSGRVARPFLGCSAIALAFGALQLIWQVSNVLGRVLAATELLSLDNGAACVPRPPRQSPPEGSASDVDS